MLVDDDPAIRGTTATVLKRAGYRVRAFANVAAFLAANRAGGADIILIDVRRKGADGRNPLEAIGGREGTTPVVAMTGRGGIAAAIAAMRLGAVDFLEKPCPPEALIAAIGRALAPGSSGGGGAADPEAAARIGALSRRQADVLRGILNGQANKAIAHRLGLSVRSVEAYRGHMIEKLGASGTADAVRIAIAAGMLKAG